MSHDQYILSHALNCFQWWIDLFLILFRNHLCQWISRRLRNHSQSSCFCRQCGPLVHDRQRWQNAERPWTWRKKLLQLPAATVRPCRRSGPAESANKQSLPEYSYLSGLMAASFTKSHVSASAGSISPSQQPQLHASPVLIISSRAQTCPDYIWKIGHAWARACSA